MKRIIAGILASTMLLSAIILPSCNSEDAQTDTSSLVELVSDGTAKYNVVRARTIGKGNPILALVVELKDQLNTTTGVEFESATDAKSKADYEILIGSCDREETNQVVNSLADGEYAIKVVGNKIVLCGKDETGTYMAVRDFIDNYAKGGEIPADLEVKNTVDYTQYINLVYDGKDFSLSSEHNMSYTEMGHTVLKAFTRDHYRDGNLLNTEVWDAAEILEAYIDAYEQTGNEAYLKYVEGIAASKFGANSARTDWCRNNPYNDDISWICIAFARIYLLTGNKKYLNLSKSNFDTMWDRAYSPDVLGGGLWWKDDQKDTKNSCIQCPASIAACLIAKATGDDSYYEKAKELMDWEFENLFIPNTGKVYDNYQTNGNKSDWSSTYNQGTFVGACILLHEKYGDQKYLDYAAKAVGYGMSSLDNINGVLNGESGGNDLPGFKGILTRWFYRYAEYTNDLDVLEWLQKNADTAFGNRNSKDKIWTHWAEPTDENTNYDIWGLSAAMALMFNCEPWW